MFTIYKFLNPELELNQDFHDSIVYPNPQFGNPPIFSYQEERPGSPQYYSVDADHPTFDYSTLTPASPEELLMIFNKMIDNIKNGHEETMLVDPEWSDITENESPELHPSERFVWPTREKDLSKINPDLFFFKHLWLLGAVTQEIMASFRKDMLNVIADQKLVEDFVDANGNALSTDQDSMNVLQTTLANFESLQDLTTLKVPYKLSDGTVIDVLKPTMQQWQSDILNRNKDILNNLKEKSDALTSGTITLEQAVELKAADMWDMTLADIQSHVPNMTDFLNAWI